jgi:hypothetical protein
LGEKRGKDSISAMIQNSDRTGSGILGGGGSRKVDYGKRPILPRAFTKNKLGGWNRSFNYMATVPFEINWPEFFVSRLGVQL